MIAIKTKMKALPEYCDECTWYQCIPHPDKGWTQGCGLMMQCLDDDQPEKWRYDGNERPKACPLFDTDQMPANIRWTPVEEAMPEYDRYYLWCDRRGNIQVARYKQDIPDHFFPSQMYFTIEDAVAWAPLPAPYKSEEEEQR